MSSHLLVAVFHRSHLPIDVLRIFSLPQPQPGWIFVEKNIRLHRFEFMIIYYEFYMNFFSMSIIRCSAVTKTTSQADGAMLMLWTDRAYLQKPTRFFNSVSLTSALLSRPFRWQWPLRARVERVNDHTKRVFMFFSSRFRVDTLFAFALSPRFGYWLSTKHISFRKGFISSGVRDYRRLIQNSRFYLTVVSHFNFHVFCAITNGLCACVRLRRCSSC